VNSELALVSVLMTAYNREKYIAEAIESVLASSYTNFELIIVDDGSRDSTVAIAKKFEQKDTRIRVYINEKNLGDYPNRNYAASLAIGKYIMYCDSDDSFKQNAIQYCVEALEKFPGSYMGMYTDNGRKEPYVIEGAEGLNEHFFIKPFLCVGPGGTILNRDFFYRIGQYPTKYGPANDMYFDLKAICYTSIVLLPYEFLNYRIHDQQEKNNNLGYLQGTYTYTKDAFDELPLPLSKKKIVWLKKKAKRRFLVNIIRYSVVTGNIKQGYKIYKQSAFKLKDIFDAVFQQKILKK
jgi:glycosyltransferase involved in cell wall biosynthesis